MGLVTGQGEGCLGAEAAGMGHDLSGAQGADARTSSSQGAAAWTSTVTRPASWSAAKNLDALGGGPQGAPGGLCSSDPGRPGPQAGAMLDQIGVRPA